MAITTADWGRLYKLLYVVLDMSICSLAIISLCKPIQHKFKHLAPKIICSMLCDLVCMCIILNNTLTNYSVDVDMFVCVF